MSFCIFSYLVENRKLWKACSQIGKYLYQQSTSRIYSLFFPSISSKLLHLLSHIAIFLYSCPPLSHRLVRYFHFARLLLVPDRIHYSALVWLTTGRKQFSINCFVVAFNTTRDRVFLAIHYQMFFSMKTLSKIHRLSSKFEIKLCTFKYSSVYM